MTPAAGLGPLVAIREGMTLPLALALNETARFGGRTENDLWPAFLVVAAAVGGLALVAWGLKRFSIGSLRTRTARRSLELVEVLPLGGQKRIAVVRCYDRTFVLGAGDKELSLLAEVEPPDERSRLEQLAVRADEAEAAPAGDLGPPQPLQPDLRGLPPERAAKVRALHDVLEGKRRERAAAGAHAEQGFERLIDAARERLEARIAQRRRERPTPRAPDARGAGRAPVQGTLEELA